MALLLHVFFFFLSICIDKPPTDWNIINPFSSEISFDQSFRSFQGSSSVHQSSLAFSSTPWIEHQASVLKPSFAYKEQSTKQFSLRSSSFLRRPPPLERVTCLHVLVLKLTFAHYMFSRDLRQQLNNLNGDHTADFPHKSYDAPVSLSCMMSILTCLCIHVFHDSKMPHRKDQIRCGFVPAYLISSLIFQI